MKKVLLAVVILVGLSTVANAQTNKGTWLLGGSAGFANQGSESAWNINPSIGNFIKDNLAIGGEIALAGSSQYDGTATTISAYVKPYFGGSDTNKWFAKAGLGMFKSQYMTENKFAYGVGFGNATFLNKSVALEVSANYKKIADIQDGVFDFNVGFQIHFGGK
jgi:hypothetical protein